MKKCAVFIVAMIILQNSFVFAMPTQMKSETVYINLGDYRRGY